MSGSFPVSKDLWKISCRIGANSLCKVCRTMGLNLSGPAALSGFKATSSLSMLSAAMFLYQAVWGRDWAGIMGWHQSHANLVVTSGQGTLSLWGFGAKH